MSDNGVSTAEGAPKVEIDTTRVLDIIREEQPLVYETAVRRAVIEAQSKLIEDLTARLGGTVP